MKKQKTWQAQPIKLKKMYSVWRRSLLFTGKTLIIPVYFEQTVREWTGDKPKFRSEVERGSLVMVHQIRLTGPEKGIKKWFWLSFGTAVRYAVMSQDFVSKTQPGTTANRKGAGGFSHFSKFPLPGIEARDWHNIIRLAAGPLYRSRLVAATRRNIDLLRPKSKVVFI